MTDFAEKTKNDIKYYGNYGDGLQKEVPGLPFWMHVITFSNIAWTLLSVYAYCLFLYIEITKGEEDTRISSEKWMSAALFVLLYYLLTKSGVIVFSFSIPLAVYHILEGFMSGLVLGANFLGYSLSQRLMMAGYFMVAETTLTAELYSITHRWKTSVAISCITTIIGVFAAYSTAESNSSILDWMMWIGIFKVFFAIGAIAKHLNPHTRVCENIRNQVDVSNGIAASIKQLKQLEEKLGVLYANDPRDEDNGSGNQQQPVQFGTRREEASGTLCRRRNIYARNNIIDV